VHRDERRDALEERATVLAGIGDEERADPAALVDDRKRRRRLRVPLAELGPDDGAVCLDELDGDVTVEAAEDGDYLAEHVVGVAATVQDAVDRLEGSRLLMSQGLRPRRRRSARETSPGSRTAVGAQGRRVRASASR